MKHGSRQFSGLRVLTARVIGRDQHDSSRQAPFSSVAEFGLPPPGKIANVLPDSQECLECHMAQRNHNPLVYGQANLSDQVFPAAIHLCGKRLIAGRSTTGDCSDESIAQD